MILHEIQIHCSPEADPTNVQTFVWKRFNGDVFSVECAISKLQEWVDQQKSNPALISDNNEPIA